MASVLQSRARSKRASARQAEQSRERSVFSGATRPLPLELRSSSRGNGRVAPLKNAALTALFGLVS